MARVTRTPGAGQQQLQSLIRGLTDKSCKVGWMESSKYDDDNKTPVAYVAAIQEFGHGAIPPRPFMRPTIARDEPKWKKIAERESRNMLSGSDSVRLLETLGEFAVGGIKRSIADVNSPPLSPITLRLRKLKMEGKKITGKTVGEAAKHVKDGGDVGGVSTKPLVFDGILLNSVVSVVE